MTKSSTKCDVNLDEARRFLNLLAPKATKWWFQTFDDKGRNRARRLTTMRRGSFDDLMAEDLTLLNEGRAGIFVGLNITDGKGRKKENIKTIRAVTVDLDGAPLDPVLECPLKPHIIIETSPKRYHAIWRVKGLALDQFEDVQRGIAKRFDGDSEIAKLTHIERLPGFYHNKGDPFLVRIIESHEEPPYSAEQILKEFPPEQNPHKPPKSLAGRVILSSTRPLASANEFVRRQYVDEQQQTQTLRFYRGSYYEWDGTCYGPRHHRYIKSKIYEFLKDAIEPSGKTFVPFNPTPAKVNAILDALESLLHEDEDIEMPAWLPPMQGDTANLIACRNGLLNVETRKLLPHTPLFFDTACLPFDYDPNAPTYPNQWMTFLRQLWPDDKQARQTLQEMFGLMLTADTSLHKLFMLVGPKRSGKGTIGRVLSALVGKNNAVGPTLHSLGSEFGLQQLIDKRVAIIADARLGTRASASAIAERLLSASGGDLHTINRKFKEHWHGHLKVRFLILTNELPRIADASGALPSRFVLLTLKESFYGREDANLTDKLLTELPAILNWALRGLERLRKRGRFKMPESSNQAIRTLEDLASPISAFVRDWCVVDPNQEVNVKFLFKVWSVWGEQEGHRRGSNIVFGRNLKAYLTQVSTTGRGEDRRYCGLGLSQEGQKQYEKAWRSSPNRKDGDGERGDSE